MKSTYVVGIDGSGPSDAALRWAVQRAASVGAPVLLVHVIDDEGRGADYGTADDAERRGERLLARAKALAGELVSTVDVHTRLVHGGLVWTLATAPGDDDLLVIGTHKTGYLLGRVSGSRSVSIASLARCSVAVVPDISLTSRYGVIAGVDRSAGLAPAVASASREARRLEQDAVLVHAAHPAPATASEADEFLRLEGQRSLLRDAVNVAHSATPDAKVRTQVSRRSPVDALLDASRDASLLVLGASTRRGAAQAIVGATTHDVLMNINVPVLIARSSVV